MKSVQHFRFARSLSRASMAFLSVFLVGAIVASAAQAQTPQRPSTAASTKAQAKTSKAVKAPKPTAKAVKVSTPVAKTLAHCSWNRPGQNPYMGELPGAVDRYGDIPAAVRAKLRDRIAAQQYDDMVEIRRDAIVGKGIYAPDIRDMHFGKVGTVCKTVSRKKWKASTVERGLVYCESAQCVLVPTVCRNVSRVTRRDPPPEAKKPGPVAPIAAAPSSTPAVPAAGKPEAPSAGVAPDPGAPVAPPASAPVLVATGPSFSEGSQGPAIGFPMGSGSTVFAPPSAVGGTTVGGGTTTPGGATPGGATPGTTPGTPPGGGTTPGGTTPGGSIPDPGSGGTPPGGAVGGVVVSAVPEASTWALMWGGVLAIAFLARRRRPS